MKSSFLETPPRMTMGFHYTRQYSRRTRVNVMGLVDHSTDAWDEWYVKAHELETLERIAQAGYDLIEIHFLYGFGLKSEREEIELTRKMTANAHATGVKVLGYFQFFSIQQELFFVENPWARNCLQIDAEGKRLEYAYDRPALCFSHQRVRDYYLDGVEIGLKECDLDGIRLDNDYYKGCYCAECQKAFQTHLSERFPPDLATKVFGFSDLSGLELAPVERRRDPLWLETVKFRQKQRQDMMRAINEKLRSIKPDAILGGNPAIGRQPDDPARCGVYIPDLGETHHLACSENAMFPARHGDTYARQVVNYKHAQSNDFKIYLSAHCYVNKEQLRWPESEAECALGMCEPLCFGGHVSCATWGIRYDATTGDCLFERPHFIQASKTVADFLANHGEIYQNVQCDADVGVYLNRESLSVDQLNSWYSTQGLVQTLLTAKIPFRFIDRDDEQAFTGLKTIIVPNIRLVGDQTFELLKRFATTGNLVLTGESCQYDEHYLQRDLKTLSEFRGQDNVIWLKNTPEKVSPEQIDDIHGKCRCVPIPAGAREIIDAIRKRHPTMLQVEGSPFIAIDTFINDEGARFIHLLNYDNARPVDVSIELSEPVAKARFHYPNGYGPKVEPSITQKGQSTTIGVTGFNVYMVVELPPK